MMEGPRHLRILFLTDHYCDYLSDPLYIGLSRVLGNEQVMEYPYKAAYHEPRVRYWFMAQRPGKNYSREEITDLDRKSTRLNSSHGYISYAVFCLKKKKIQLTD